MSGFLKLPIVIIFKNTKRANAKVRMKVIKSMDIDKFLNVKTKVPGIPESAVYLQIGVGNEFKERYTKQYKL
jgi:hypothetical protein